MLYILEQKQKRKRVYCVLTYGRMKTENNAVNYFTLIQELKKLLE